ncbi:MAG: SLBB domain-containing protein [Eubacterium ramulus]
MAALGVYEVSVDSRIYEAVEQAGGMLDTAKTRAVNLAEPLTDGQMIRIPFQERRLSHRKTLPHKTVVSDPTGK